MNFTVHQVVALTTHLFARIVVLRAATIVIGSLFMNLINAAYLSGWIIGGVTTNLP